MILNDVKIEVCCSSVQDAINAEKGEADRIELNSALAYGGLTPGIASLKKVKELVDIPVMAMIRPRSGGFNYSKLEFEIMKEEMKLIKETGVVGVVFGILNEKAKIDYKKNKILQEISEDLITVFHRAYDVIPDPIEGIDILNELGFDRVLTSAQENKIENNLYLAKKIINYSEGKLDVVLCGGIRDYNVKQIVFETECKEIHFSAFKKKKDNSMNDKEIKFNACGIAEDKYKMISKDKILSIKNKLNN